MFDEVDKKLIELLQQNSRMSYTDLSKAVHLSRPSVVERIHKLLDQGVIERFTTSLSVKHLGYSASMLIQISNINISVDEMLKVLNRDDIIEIYAVTGKENFIVKAVAKNLDDMQDLLKELMQYGTIVTALIIDKYSTKKNLKPA